MARLATTKTTVVHYTSHVFSHSILRRLLHAVDHETLKRRFSRFQFQAKLLNRSKDGSAGIARRRHSVRSGSHSRCGEWRRDPVHLEIITAIESSFFENRPAGLPG